MRRYIVANEGWFHLFEDLERECRFVLDSHTDELVAADLRLSGQWVPAFRGQYFDLKDSLLHSQPGLFEDPESYGLISANHPPSWA
jgi:hypothetical protein